MTYEILAKDWSEALERLNAHVPYASWSYAFCDYEHSETGEWTEIILFSVFKANEYDLLLFKLSVAHLLRGTTKEDCLPAI